MEACRKSKDSQTSDPGLKNDSTFVPTQHTVTKEKTSEIEQLLSQLQGKSLVLPPTSLTASKFHSSAVVLWFVCLFLLLQFFDLFCLHLESQLQCKHVLKSHLVL